MAKKKKRGLVEWVIILCWIAAAILLIYTFRIWDVTYPPHAFYILIGQLVLFARAIVNTALINGAIDELGYNNKFYHKLRLPKKMQVFCLGYDAVQGVYGIVLAIKCINFINLVLSSVYTGFYPYGARNAFSFPWESYNRLGYSLFLFIGIFYAIVGIYTVCLVEKIEKKQTRTKWKFRPFADIEAKHQIEELQWKLNLTKSLEKCCHKHNRRMYLFEKDIATIEKRILSCYEKLIEYGIETNDKGKKTLVIRAESDGKIIFEAPLR